MVVDPQGARGAIKELPIIAQSTAMKRGSPPMHVVATFVDAEVNCVGRATRNTVVLTMREDGDTTGLTSLIDQLHSRPLRERRGAESAAEFGTATGRKNWSQASIRRMTSAANYAILRDTWKDEGTAVSSGTAVGPANYRNR